ncbi:arsenate reductase family protein [Halovulum sp. GXIMD14793]
MILYGLKACDTCRAAIKALQAAGHDVSFFDIRATPLEPAQIAQFLEAFGDALVNRRSTTWRGLSEQERSRLPAELLADNPPLMKRPVIADARIMTLGWDTKVQGQWLS